MRIRPYIISALALLLVAPIPRGQNRSIEQTSPGTRPSAELVESFDGLGAGLFALLPPRNPSGNSLAVGPDHIIQTVNSQLVVFTKTGKRFDTTGKVLYGPIATNTAFAGLGGVCEARPNGDAVVRYDQLAGRWLIVMQIFRRVGGKPASDGGQTGVKPRLDQGLTVVADAPPGQWTSFEGAIQHLLGNMKEQLADLEGAARVVYAAMTPTPQQRWPLLDARCGTGVWVKHENHTPVGAFKVRGGLVYFDHLHRAEPDLKGAVAATRGNHGQSIGFAASRLGIPAAVVVPHGNSETKNAAMRALGLELIERGHDFQASLEASAEIAEARGWHQVPSFHPLLVRGVASYSLELLRAAPIDILYVPIGLGSGICGALAVRDALNLRTRIVGVVSAAAPAYARSLALGRPVSHESTTRIADGMACRTPDADALAIIRAGTDHVVEVTDDEVEEAMRALFTDTHNVVEGAGAASLAALLKERTTLRGQTAAIVLTGANVDPRPFARVLEA